MINSVDTVSGAWHVIVKSGVVDKGQRHRDGVVRSEREVADNDRAKSCLALFTPLDEVERRGHSDRQCRRRPKWLQRVEEATGVEIGRHHQQIGDRLSVKSGADNPTGPVAFQMQAGLRQQKLVETIRRVVSADAPHAATLNQPRTQCQCHNRAFLPYKVLGTIFRPAILLAPPAVW